MRGRSQIDAGDLSMPDREAFIHPDGMRLLSSARLNPSIALTMLDLPMNEQAWHGMAWHGRAGRQRGVCKGHRHAKQRNTAKEKQNCKEARGTKDKTEDLKENEASFSLFELE